MSIVLVERCGLLAQTQEDTLRLRMNRANREWWRRAAHIPLARWPSWRDANLAAILDALDWLPIWRQPDGEYVIRQGMGRTVAAKAGDRITFYDISSSGNRCDLEEVWRLGEPCPYAYTIEKLAAASDDLVQTARLEVLRADMPDDCVRTWSDSEQEAADRIYRLACDGNWEAAARIAKETPLPWYFGMKYLECLVESGDPARDPGARLS